MEKELPKLTSRQIERQLKAAFRKANQTPEQKSHALRVKNWQAKKREEARKLNPKELKKIERGRQLAASRPVRVILTLQHMINGKAYGPGEAWVPQAQADDFLATEARHRQQEEKFYGTQSVIIGRRVRGQVTAFQVPNETFDSNWGDPSNPQQIVADAVSGKNMTDSGEGRKF